jgi:hypothetical protein
LGRAAPEPNPTHEQEKAEHFHEARHGPRISPTIIPRGGAKNRKEGQLHRATERIRRSVSPSDLLRAITPTEIEKREPAHER